MAWVAAAKDRREREMAADRHVLAGGMDIGTYASLLLRLARDSSASPACGMVQAHRVGR